MKNFTKIFTAIVALMALSCTTDTTEDLSVPGANGGLTSITLSLEEARTQLGEEADGIYPLLWSEGDQISVNGVASQPLTVAQAGQASATFSVEVVADSYEIAYPAANAGQVLFAENQTHVANNTFGNGVTTMYAKCTADEPIQLQHLTSILKIGVSGEAKLTHAQISTIDRAPIAGAFAVSEEGEVAATATSKSVINYSFGEGLQLTADAQYIHVAVPAGEYNELYVTLYDSNNGVMYATVNADDKNPLTAGKLRKFTNSINYKATDKLVVIKNYADLKAFAAVAAETTANVVLANDIEITEAWTPIEGYAGTVIGHGYAIKGLTAPLFGTTSASFKGLHLEGVNIVETANPNVGALARTIVATDTVKPVVENCSASGTIQVNCTSYQLSGDDKYSPFAIGGVVGHIKGADLNGVVSNVALDVDQILATSNKTKVFMSVGGVVGYVNNYSETVLSNLANCESKGNIDIHEVSYTTVSYDAGLVLPYIGGVAGYMAISNHGCTVANLTNHGNIGIRGYYGVGEGGTADINYTDVDGCLAGVVGYLDSVNASGLKNYGSLTFDNGRIWFLYLGGVTGQLGANAVLTDSENHGKITLPYTGDTVPKIVFLHCGGVVGHTWENSKLSGCDNYGGIAVTSNLTVGGASGHRYFRVGGVAAFTCGEIENCHNKKGANIDISGSIGGAPNWQDDAIAGVVAVAYHHSVKNCSNSGAVKSGCNNNSTNTAYLGHTNVGGVVGIASKYCENVTNNGKIILMGNQKVLYLGGVVGFLGKSTNNDKLGGYYNNGEIEFRGSEGSTTTSACEISGNAQIGGCIGRAEGAVYSAINKGKLGVNGVKHGGENRYGGVVGYLTAEGIHDSENHGLLHITNKTAKGHQYVAGITSVVSGSGSDLLNKGNMELTFTYTGTANTRAYISGIGGYVGGASSNFLNQGTITVNGSLEQTRIGGIAANGDAAGAANCTFTNFVNEGDIIFNADVTFNSNNHACIGGLWGDCNTAHTLVNCGNKGNITVSKDASTTSGSTSNQVLYVGGLFGFNRSAVKTLKGCFNTGNITIEEGAEIVKGPYTGGCFGKFDKAPVIGSGDLRTTGTVKVLNGATATNDNRCGGVVGWNAEAIGNAEVYCDVIAIGTKGAGLVTGMARNTSYLANSNKLGGRIATALKDGEPDFYNVVETMPEPEYDASGDPMPIEGQFIEFWNVIYGNTWADASASNCDGNTYISSLTIE